MYYLLPFSVDPKLTKTIRLQFLGTSLFNITLFFTVMDHINKLQIEVFEVKTDNGLKIIYARNILYIKAARKFSVIYFNDGTYLIGFHMLNWFEKFLCPPCFFRCHNSYLINCYHVDSFGHSKVILKEKNKIPLSRKKMNHFRENLKQFHIMTN